MTCRRLRGGIECLSVRVPSHKTIGAFFSCFLSLSRRIVSFFLSFFLSFPQFTLSWNKPSSSSSSQQCFWYSTKSRQRDTPVNVLCIASRVSGPSKQTGCLCFVSFLSLFLSLSVSVPLSLSFTALSIGEDRRRGPNHHDHTSLDQSSSRHFHATQKLWVASNRLTELNAHTNTQQVHMHQHTNNTSTTHHCTHTSRFGGRMKCEREGHNENEALLLFFLGQRLSYITPERLAQHTHTGTHTYTNTHTHTQSKSPVSPMMMYLNKYA